MKLGSWLVIGAVALVGLGRSVANADSITFSAGEPAPGVRSASVTFTTDGSTLRVRLTNESVADADVPSDVLTAVFFKISGFPSLTLTRQHANIASGSVYFNDTTPPIPTDTDGDGLLNVDGEWAYRSGLSTYGANQGISSTGLNLFGPNDVFGPPDLDWPNSPSGINYGLAPAGYSTGGDNGGLSGTPVVKNSIVFSLGGLPSGFSVQQSISNITFQYGTSLSEAHLGGSPTPPSAVPLPSVAGAGILLLGGLAVKRSRRN